ncbi:MAG: Transcriptional regulator of heat shock protein [uncultured bacterium]|uniref:Heat-inducible transcription repressor HrcA n=1 Tax=Candidatus Uhrbacteria bacterium GW2011_GWC1_41_20 TaxID=1618983 RepID=A0A0G0XQB9_9BACT|nr:MAG: Transcriptional regulator of heat shock protein [uncultured bacterium]KKR22539.1 MAG: Transcriptional regulator of heat shock protein [Candidatus Uhrbacteria bacterium GW2011_GWE1_39_46]KKR63846.1 MAG: Transcriptional regulator of heat shock protein [Candidatus Uhrbacteria bacterium GW2011_GWC2_40_450]KKR90082.1 MAG: Transcriptional regulator of heat shock protein [Candidatus Uhrbacteria bacterium GW2011_GWD2_41_121]KKR96042.1 MAG: Transcriptional regulator of heat shock protein [Candid
MLNQRQLSILSAIIEEHVQTAQPVASRTLVSKYAFSVSPATIRNDMAILEEAGFLRQPHTSAGRVPTEAGYRLYLEQPTSASRKVKSSEMQMQKAIANVSTPRELVQEMAQCLTRLSGEAAVASLDAGWNHYTGISKLFDKPEFSDVVTLRALSTIVDRFDQTLRDIFGDIDDDVNIWIGGENPFGEQIATMMVKYKLPNGMIGTLGLIGPMRMNYEKNICLLEQAKELLDSKL